MHQWRTRLAAVVLACCAAGAAHAATSLTYTRTDLPDTVVGQDAWRHTYTFSGALDPFHGLTLIYDHTRFADLQLGSVDAVLSELVIQPDTGLAADGLVELTAMSALAPSFSTQFDLDFVRTGALADHHPYEVFDDGFNVIASGNATLAPIPEPSVAALMVSGIVLVAAWRRRSATPPS